MVMLICLYAENGKGLLPRFGEIVYFTEHYPSIRKTLHHSRPLNSLNDQGWCPCVGLQNPHGPLICKCLEGEEKN